MSNTLSNFYSDVQLIEIINLRNSGLQWPEVSEAFNLKYSTNVTSEAIRHAYRKYKDSFDLSNEKAQVAQLKSIVRTKQTAAKTAKENKAILQYLANEEELLERIQELVESIKHVKFKPHKPVVHKGKRPMTIEQMLSDLHYGKLTDTFDLSVARRRMTELKDTLLSEIARCNKVYNVERVILALIGDIIESSTMHGVESAKGCEFGNSRQVQEAINSIFYDMILPVAMTGIKVDIPAVTGNHDRTETSRTMNDPGEENLTYIIYKTLELLCKQTGLNNVNFYIPKSPYVTLEIYGNTACYEHFDNSKANTRQALENLLNKRQTQVKKIISFYRGGHWHDETIYGRGKIIVNGSLPGQDSYGDVNGFESHAVQIMNFYVPTDKRPNCYYRSFPVHLL